MVNRICKLIPALIALTAPIAEWVGNSADTPLADGMQGRTRRA